MSAITIRKHALIYRIEAWVLLQGLRGFPRTGLAQRRRRAADLPAGEPRRRQLPARRHAGRARHADPRTGRAVHVSSHSYFGTRTPQTVKLVKSSKLRKPSKQM